LLGTNHALVGMALLQSWGLPENISHPVGLHHTQNTKESEHINAKIVYLSNFLVESIGIRSVMPENLAFNVQEFIDQNQVLPEVPNFHENMEKIIDEFFYQFNETVSLC